MAVTEARRFSLIKIKKKLALWPDRPPCAVGIDRDLSRIEIHTRTTFFIV